MTDARRTPLELAESPTLPAVLDAYADTYPQQSLIIADDGTATAAEFAASVRRFAGHLQQQGIQPGDVVGVLLPNGRRWMVAVMGTLYLGAICVPVNTFYKQHELREAVDRTHMSLLYADRTVVGRDFTELLREADLLRADNASQFRGTVFWPRDADAPEGTTIGPPVATPTPRGEDPALYVFTSGSSAKPKIVVLNHANLVHNCYEIGRRQHVVPGDRLWMASPMFFGYGCANALLVVLTHGLTFCLQERFDPEESAKFIAANQCTVYYGLGQMTRGLIAADAHRRHDLSTLRTGTTGFSAEEKRLAIEELGVTGVCSVYGLTEGNGHSAMTDADDPADVKLHTQGTVLPTQEMRISDPTSGEIYEWGDDLRLGEIQLRGCVTTGYLEDPVANAQVFTSDGWFRTGDLGAIDAAGRLHFAGRLKEVIKVSGITVSPAEVETAVEAHPAVDQAWAFGWPDSQTGEEQLCCAVVLTRPNDLQDDAAENLKTWLKARISSYKVPKAFIILDKQQVPTTATGKVSKRLIGEQFLGAATTPETVS
ncbi:class I adenylate-forming enzyme family protein [Nocardioides sp. KR10-350]|uniref:class I adenylate-forming enzyme family protein n=1 Tax=Nocardioides cheoyonin TaxID=3156615 RepID=UPI0032B5A1DC